MKTHLYALRFFILSFTIAALVFVSICVIASLDITKNQGGFSLDVKNYSFTLFGTKYILDKNVSTILDHIFDYNSVFFGSNATDCFLSVINFVPNLFADLLECTISALSGFISAGT